MHEAAQWGAVEAARLILEDAPQAIRATDILGRTPLHVAVEGRLMKPSDEAQTSIARLLIRAGADVHARDNSGEAPLQVAAKSGSVHAAEALLNAGADPAVRQAYPGHQPDFPKRFSALQYAARNGHVEVVRLLLDHGAPVIYPTHQKWGQAESALHDACNPRLAYYDDGNNNLPPGFTRDLEVVDLLMTRVGGPNIVAAFEHATPLQVALRFGHDRIAHHLVEKYTLVDATKARGTGRSVGLIAQRAVLQLAGRAPGQDGNNTPPRVADLAYTPPKEGIDAGGFVTGTIADETRRPGHYAVEVDFEGDGKPDAAGRFPADRWGFTYESHLAPGERELWVRVIEHPVGPFEPLASEWRHLKFTATSPPNEPPWMWRFHFRKANDGIQEGSAGSASIGGVFQDLTWDGSDYRVEVDADGDGDGRADLVPEHVVWNPEGRDDWAIMRKFDATVMAPAGRDAIRVRIVEFRDGPDVADSGWLPGLEPTR